MRTKSRTIPLTLGEFIGQVYEVWGKRKAKGIVRLAIKAHLIELRGRQRLMIS